MPLSEWDVLALDECGRSSNGTSETSPAGVVVSPFEGVLQTASAECWNPMGSFPSPQFGVVRAGEIGLLDITVVAQTLSHPAGAVRGMIWATWFLRGAEIAATVGITVRGFDDLGKYAGVTPADVKALKDTIARWAKVGRVPAELSALGTAHVLRFNQGDAFFAKQMGHACSATAPGYAELPMLYHTQRRESMEPHIVRRDAAGNLPVVAGKVRPRKKKAAGKTAAGKAAGKTTRAGGRVARKAA